jgi:hypothetical protein
LAAACCTFGLAAVLVSAAFGFGGAIRLLAATLRTLAALRGLLLGIRRHGRDQAAPVFFGPV